MKAKNCRSFSHSDFLDALSLELANSPESRCFATQTDTFPKLTDNMIRFMSPSRKASLFPKFSTFESRKVLDHPVSRSKVARSKTRCSLDEETSWTSSFDDFFGSPCWKSDELSRKKIDCFWNAILLLFFAINGTVFDHGTIPPAGGAGTLPETRVSTVCVENAPGFGL